MGSESQGWIGQLPAILRFLPRQSCCFLHFLELLSKLGQGMRGEGQEQTVDKPLAFSSRAPPGYPHPVPALSLRKKL